MDRVHVLGAMLASASICVYARTYAYVDTMLVSSGVCGYAYVGTMLASGGVYGSV